MIGKTFAANALLIKSTAINVKGQSMIISEKQIMQLMVHVHGYISTLQTVNVKLTEAGDKNLHGAIALLNTIYNQQSQELKVIE
jgi:hypothetical protein